MTAPTRRQRDVRGIAFAAIAAIAFGTLAISAKYAYRAGADAIPLLATRFALASVLLALYHMMIRRPLTIGRDTFVRATFAGGFLYALEASLFFAALKRAPAAVISLVFYSYPLWTTLLGFATRLEPFRWQLLGALALGGTGVAIVFSVPSASLAGPLLALAAALAVALYFIFMQVLLRDIVPSVAAMWTSAGAAVALAIISFATGQEMPAAALPAALGLAVASALAFVFLYEAITLIGSARSSIAAMLEPITTLILAVIFLNEELTFRVIIGAALIVAVLPLLARAGHTEPVASPPDAI